MVLVVRFIMIKIVIWVIFFYIKVLYSYINDYVKYLYFCYVIEWFKLENYVMNYNYILLEFECIEFEFVVLFFLNINVYCLIKIINIR